MEVSRSAGKQYAERIGPWESASVLGACPGVLSDLQRLVMDGWARPRPGASAAPYNAGSTWSEPLIISETGFDYPESYQDKNLTGKMMKT